MRGISLTCHKNAGFERIACSTAVNLHTYGYAMLTLD